jgi:hypothetical protein
LNTSLADKETRGDIIKVRRAALGFLRTYFYLIAHESDFRIAQRPELSLIPTEVSWDQLCAFSSGFDAIQDEEVSGQYHFGEIWLSRLKFYAPILLRKAYFHRIHHRYSEYFGRFYGPVLAGLSSFSIILGSMQVAGQDMPASSTRDEIPDLPWGPPLFLWFSLSTIQLVIVVLLALAMLWCVKTAKEWRRAIVDWRRFQRRLPEDRPDMKTGDSMVMAIA